MEREMELAKFPRLPVDWLIRIIAQALGMRDSL